MSVKNRNYSFYIKKICIYFFLSVIFCVTVFPFLMMLSVSFKETYQLNSFNDLISGFSSDLFKNYKDVWVSGPFDTYFLNTFLLTVTVIISNLFFDSLISYALSRKNFKGKKTIFILILVRMMIPVQILIIPFFFLIREIGMYDTLFALYFPNMIQGFGIFLMKQYFDGIPKTLDEAAKIDGASDLQILFRILLPISKPAIAVLIINTALSTWNSFLLPLILTQSVDNRVLGLGLALYNSQYNVNIVNSMAASTISVLPILILFLFFQKYIISGLTKGAVK